jgi:hypothetical protein
VAKRNDDLVWERRCLRGYGKPKFDVGARAKRKIGRCLFYLYKCQNEPYFPELYGHQINPIPSLSCTIFSKSKKVVKFTTT